MQRIRFDQEVIIMNKMQEKAVEVAFKLADKKLDAVIEKIKRFRENQKKT